MAKITHEFMINFFLQNPRPILYLKRQQKMHPAQRFEILRSGQHDLLITNSNDEEEAVINDDDDDEDDDDNDGDAIDDDDDDDLRKVKFWDCPLY